MPKKENKIKQKTTQPAASKTRGNHFPLIFDSHGKLQKTNILVLSVSSALFIYFSALNIVEYQQHNVVTTTTTITEINSIFPAVTFCFNKPLKIKEILRECILTFKDVLGYYYSANNFDNFKIQTANINLSCFTFNGGYNASGDKIELIELDFYSYNRSVDFYFVIPLYISIWFYIGDNSERPGFVDLRKSHQSDTIIHSYEFQKKINQRIGKPFNNCSNKLITEDDYDSDVYKQLMRSTKYKYRLTNCFDLCDVLNSNVNDSFLIRECYKKCPENCDSIVHSSYATMKPMTSEKYKFIYDLFAFSVTPQQMTHLYISQVPQITAANLFSNIGGLAGLFLGTSVIGIYQLNFLVAKLLFKHLSRAFDDNRIFQQA